MTAPTSDQAYVLRDALVTIEDTEYENLFVKTRLVPKTDVQTLTTLVPDGVVQDVGTTIWEWQVTIAADWTASTGLAAVFNDNNGDQLDVVMAPKNSSGKPQASFTIVSMPVDFGGDQGAFNTVDAVFPVVGQPTFSTVSS
jgi:hypothetical protein